MTTNSAAVNAKQNDPVSVTNLDDLAVGTMKMVHVDGERICVARTTDGVFAVDQACPHEGYGLTTGELDGDLITCAWHNWKFRVSDGHCVLGEEDVRSHEVTVSEAGEVAVTLTTIDPAAERPRLLASLGRGIERNYMGQVSRDVIRLLRIGVDPIEIVAEAVRYGTPRTEYGWDHSLASLTDCAAMIERYEGDERALPIVQAIAGVAEEQRGRPVQPLPEPDRGMAEGDRRAAFRAAVEGEELERAQAILLGALGAGATAPELRPWFSEVVSDHHLSYGHAAIYSQKAFQLLGLIGWEEAEVVLGYLVPAIVYATRADKLPYMKLFLRGVDHLDLPALAAAANQADVAAATWSDDGALVHALLGPDRTQAALAAGAALTAGATLDDVLDAVVVAASKRMLRYDTDGERDFQDDFSWLDITHALTYANAVRWHVGQHRASGALLGSDEVRHVLWTVFLANWTGRHEWHTEVSDRADSVPAGAEMRGDDLRAYGLGLQHEALLDHTGTFLHTAHAIKTSLAATQEAERLDTALPLFATERFVLEAPRLERFVAAAVRRSIDFLST